MKLLTLSLIIPGTISLFLFLLSPDFTQAAEIVPCGGPAGSGEPACQFCHLFVLFNNIINFLFRLVPPIAAFMLFFAGVKFFLAIENPGEVAKAKDVIKSVIIGLVIIYGAWAFVGVFLNSIGLADWTENIFSSWWTNGLFQINCPTTP